MAALSRRREGACSVRVACVAGLVVVLAYETLLWCVELTLASAAIFGCFRNSPATTLIVGPTPPRRRAEDLLGEAIGRNYARLGPTPAMRAWAKPAAWLVRAG